jgi:restriction endonuclease Mrr
LLEYISYSNITFVLAAIIITALLLSFISPQAVKPTHKKRKIEILRSKQWLKQFRDSQKHFNDKQRFSYIKKQDHFLFEDILMSCFELRKFPIKRTKKTRDGGIDGIVYINKMKFIIQAKRYTNHIAKADVLALKTLVENDPKASGGLFIHSGKSSKPTLGLGHGKDNIEIISGGKLLDFIDGKAITISNMVIPADNQSDTTV